MTKGKSLKMNMKDVEFYNVGAIENIPGIAKNCFMRIPEKVRNCMNANARLVATQSVGCEIRFVTDAPNIDIFCPVIRLIS